MKQLICKPMDDASEKPDDTSEKLSYSSRGQMGHEL